MRTHSSRRDVVRQLLLAMLVLGLTFLNFGHTSAVFAAGGRVVVTALSICGDPAGSSAGDHFACHACRPDALALPPAPAVATRVSIAVAPVTYMHVMAPLVAPFSIRAGNSRAPPLV